LKHWQLFNSQMVSKFRIEDQWVLNPISLDELIYEVPCVWKCNQEHH
ncbi:TetR/AcrR family transcriptional regulator, partial [Vibrio splendidus]